MQGCYETGAVVAAAPAGVFGTGNSTPFALGNLYQLAISLRREPDAPGVAHSV